MSLALNVEAPFLESVLARMNGFLYRCRADKEFTMLELTSGFERHFGISADEILNNRVRSFASLIHPDDAGAVDVAVVQGLQQRRNWNINYRLRHAEGYYVWVHEDGGGVWNQSDELVYFEGAVFDMNQLYASLNAQFSEAAQA